MYSREVINEVIANNDIVDVVSNYVKLKKAGSGYQGLCPFHGEKTPSFSVSRSKQIFHCFGCNMGGNVLTFIMEYEHLSFTDAVRELANRANMKIEETNTSADYKKNQQLRQNILEVNKKAAIQYYNMLRDDSEPDGASIGLRYLRNRGLTDETIRRFGLGYAAQGHSMYRYLKDTGFDDEVLKESGLFSYDKGVRDKFFNRVIFPIMDKNGKVIGFGGRVMGDGTPKYLNSPETKVYNKSEHLYGFNYAFKGRSDHFILCEGYMDVISLHQAGFSQAVASLGTALTNKQAELMKRYADKVYISYDSDSAGVKAALRAISILREAGLSIKIINMSPYKDPDELIKAIGQEGYQERINNAENAFMFQVRVLSGQFNRSDAAEEIEFQKEVARLIAGYRLKLERDSYINAVTAAYGIKSDSLEQAVREMLVGNDALAKGPEARVAAKQAVKRVKLESGVRQAEKALLTWMIEDPGIFESVKGVVAPEDFIDSMYGQVARMLYQQYESGQVNAAVIISDFDTEEEQKEVAAMFSSKLVSQIGEDELTKAVNDIVRKIKLNSISYALKNTVDINELSRLTTEKQRLKSMWIEIKSGQ